MFGIFDMQRGQDSILCMLSGGLDSTYVLYKLLTDKKYENNAIKVHHVRIDNLENRVVAEELAVVKIIEWLKKKGYYFTIIPSSGSLSPQVNNSFLLDAHIVSFMGGFICSSDPTIKQVAIGVTATDFQNSRLTDVIRISNSIFDSFTDVEKIYPLSTMTKKEIYNSLPEELRSLTWSCRTPVYKDRVPIVCGRCKTCVELKTL